MKIGISQWTALWILIIFWVISAISTAKLFCVRYKYRSTTIKMAWGLSFYCAAKVCTEIYGVYFEERSSQKVVRPAILTEYLIGHYRFTAVGMMAKEGYFPLTDIHFYLHHIMLHDRASTLLAEAIKIRQVANSPAPMIGTDQSFLGLLNSLVRYNGAFELQYSI